MATDRPRLIALTGGIGAGKSVVAQVLRAMGFPVYDCDLEARLLMDTSPLIQRRIAAEVCPEAISGAGIDRRRLSAAVFSDPRKLQALNAIVHRAVREHFGEWVSRQCRPLVFVETAILYESGLDRAVDSVWEVAAPEQVRVERVMARSGLTAGEVRSRIAAQRPSADPRHRLLDNSPDRPLLPQILSLLDFEKNNAAEGQ